jgi:hypothetical protein
MEKKKITERNNSDWNKDQARKKASKNRSLSKFKFPELF